MEIIQEKLQAAAQHEHIFTCLKQQYIETLTIINRIEEDALDSYRSNLLASATLIWESAREQKVLKRNTLKSACCSIESTLNGYVSMWYETKQKMQLTKSKTVPWERSLERTIQEQASS